MRKKHSLAIDYIALAKFINALLHNLKHNKVLDEQIIILTVTFLEVPHASESDLISVDVLPNNFYKVTQSFGFKDETNVPQILSRLNNKDLKLDHMNTSFFVGKKVLI
jgi:KUP system potassium uptake protein